MQFASDNAGPVHPKIMEALAAANEGWAIGYGNDPLTERAIQRIRDAFEAPDAGVYLTATGTACNSILLATMAKPYEIIFCTPEAHIVEDECNAPEFYTGGAKLSLIASRDGRIDPGALDAEMAKRGAWGVQGPQPGAVSITNVTERGTLYTTDYIREISDITHRHGSKLHLDGARFANACAALACTPAEMTWKAGVDAVSFGGTKNGCMGVEAAVIFDPATAWDFELRRKRGGHLFSKHRYLSAQMDAYLTDDLWLDLGRSANTAAGKLASALKQCRDVTFRWEPQANMMFVDMPRSIHRRLKNAGAVYYVWEGTLDGDPSGTATARLVTDWSCPDRAIDDFVRLVSGD
ncbi:threonine aldolase family protein [Silicimonas sp. MF1-12-2]|uniref:threonine aldolase family protein n=1 Tax=Silicimonas sp. MF1-12-2 TaxID=3384793 RepID=UPI0039B57D60